MKKKWQICFITLPTIFFLSSSLYALDSDAPDIVAGLYRNKSYIGYPLIGISNNHGQSWTYPALNTLPLPANSNEDALFRKASCTSSFCLAVGRITGGSERPLMGVSLDKGVSWDYRTVNDLLSWDGVSCNKDICAVIGRYKDHQVSPLLQIISNKGMTWTTPETITSHFPIHEYGGFNNIVCKDKQCVAVGGYANKQNTYLPLIAISADQGVSWAYPEIKLPVEAKEAGLSYVSCGDHICLAAGDFWDKNKKQHPLLLTSTDQGPWTVANVPEPPVHVGTAYYIYGISCSGSSCVVAGDYYSASYPLLMVSKNNGASWFYPESIFSKCPAPRNSYDANFNGGVSCHDTFCVAAGTYNPDPYEAKYIPWLAVSQDSGETWNYSSPLPADYDNWGVFGSVVCNNQGCIAVGDYSNGKQALPLQMISRDKGLTWVDSLDKPALPADFAMGALFNVNAGDESGMLEKITKKKQFGTSSVLAKLLKK